MTDAVRITRLLPAAPEAVWAALTTADALAAWFWPASFDTRIKIDSGYRIEARHPQMAVSGRYLEFDPPRRLVMTWRWDGDDTESLVTIELKPVEGAQTELRLVHEPHTEGHEQGWHDCLDRLPGHLTSLGLLPGHG